MAVRICDTCGAENDASERFCTTCHAYLWWDAPEEATADSVGGTTHADAPPAAADASSAAGAAADPGAATAAHPQATSPEPPLAPGTDGGGTPATREKHAAPPKVVVQTPEVTLGPDAAASVVLEIANPSEIVDGYDVVPVDPPEWLVVTTEDAHLMPGETRQVGIRLATESDQMVLAQRVTMRLDVVSQADAACRAEASLDISVPPTGPRIAISARPALLRLQDAAAGEFTLMLDNHASNHPQTLQLSASDPESAVRFAFDRTRLTVRPGAVEELTVAFSSPLPDPGAEVTRQLTVTGQHEEGPVTATLTLVQRTRPAPVDAPLRVQLSPAHLSSVNGADADFDVVLDNRGGHSARTVVLSARDPENRLGFAFTPRELTIPPEGAVTARARVRAAPPAAGSTEMRPFTVIASDGKADAEAEGMLEASATPDPMTTAALFVQPQHLNLGAARRGDLRVDVDNRRGLEPLHVRLSGSSDDGAATLRFHPEEVVVAPRATAAVQLAVEAPRPPARQSITRELKVQASDGRQAIAADASVTQATPDSRPAWSRVLVIFGVFFVVVGSFLEWFGGAGVNLPSIGRIMGVIQFQTFEGDWPYLVEAGARVLVLVLAVMMAFGMTGQSGGLTRKSAVLIVLLTVGLVIAGAVAGMISGPGLGLLAVWFGAVLGYIGGVLAKPR
ncbi:COG1470 family protein [Agromyces sp. ZXT2-6]|uniref:COG1470 family protein n=1 Tax=Agromyces sp. ZXT2-6 TaxID=3461153 RepID=UPI004054D343